MQDPHQISRGQTMQTMESSQTKFVNNTSWKI